MTSQHVFVIVRNDIATGNAVYWHHNSKIDSVTTYASQRLALDDAAWLNKHSEHSSWRVERLDMPDFKSPHVVSVKLPYRHI